MFQWPIDLNECGSPQKMISYCEQIISDIGEESKLGNNMIKILPIFEMSNSTKQRKLQLITSKKVFVDYEPYMNLELDRRIIYISADSPDKRPFIYWGGAEPFDFNNSKTYLEVLIIGPIQDPRTKIVYIDNDLCNLKMSNITFEAKEIDNNNIINTPAPTSKPFKIQEPIINAEERQAFKEVFTDIEEPEEIGISEKVRSIFGKKKELSQLEQQYILNNGGITSSDAAADRSHKWIGIRSYPTKKDGMRYKAHYKETVIKSGFAHPLDAARAYNEFIIKNGLPYPVNNIPGFLELQILEQRKNIGLKDYETWQLIEEAHKRTKPKE